METKREGENTILHVDGDSFFASCEISLNPKLKGRPVVTGQERGIATSMSQEAKALGISRGMPVFKIKKLFPQVIITHSNYQSYGIFAKRMYDIVRRYTPIVEEYSIDECFADLTGLVEPNRASEGHSGIGLEDSKQAKLRLGQSLKSSLNKELGMTFSIGIGPTKVLAKIASKHHKPDGLTVIEPSDIKAFLKEYPIGKVWGIGPQTARHMESFGIRTALDFIDKSEDWIKANFASPCLLIWHELRGTFIHPLNDNPDEDDYKSIQRTRTFAPPSQDPQFILRELSKNVEGACARARRHNLSAKHIYFFLKTQEFRYHRKEIIFPNPLSNPNDIMDEIKKVFDQVYEPDILYRTTGVTLSELVDKDHIQKDLFGSSGRIKRWDKVFQALDDLDQRHGGKMVIIGSSMAKSTTKTPLQKNSKSRGSGRFAQGSNKDKSNRKRDIDRLGIPYMGEVT